MSESGIGLMNGWIARSRMGDPSSSACIRSTRGGARNDKIVLILIFHLLISERCLVVCFLVFCVRFRFFCEIKFVMRNSIVLHRKRR